MALLPPIEIPPGLKFNSKVFDIGHFQQISPGGVGFLQTIDRTSPMWFAEYTTPPLRDDRYDEAVAFFLKLEGALESFLAYDPRRIMPRAYSSQPISTDPWTASGLAAPRVTGFNYVASTLSLDQMAEGAIITSGDYISFLVGKLWYLFRAQETVVAPAPVAPATSSVVDIRVKPRPNITGVLPVDVRYRRAVAQMKILGRVKEVDSVDSLPSFSFTAAQFLDRSTA